MYQTTIVTWILIVFGLVTCLPLILAQLVILIEPKGQRAKDILIGKGEEWRPGQGPLRGDADQWHRV